MPHFSARLFEPPSRKSQLWLADCLEIWHTLAKLFYFPLCGLVLQISDGCIHARHVQVSLNPHANHPTLSRYIDIVFTVSASHDACQRSLIRTSKQSTAEADGWFCFTKCIRCLMHKNRMQSTLNNIFLFFLLFDDQKTLFQYGNVHLSVQWALFLIVTGVTSELFIIKEWERSLYCTLECQIDAKWGYEMVIASHSMFMSELIQEHMVRHVDWVSHCHMRFSHNGSCIYYPL